MKDDAAVLSTMDDAEMMKRPHLWPQLLLPLKKRRPEGGFPETGFLRNAAPPVVIHIGTIWGGAESDETVQYPTAEEAVADGWVVD